ncbi:MAG: DUF3466 family protein [Methylococcaceae bacterium]
MSYSFTDLGTLGGAGWGTISTAAAINNFGQIVGQSITSEGWYHATLWDGATTTDLGQSRGYSNAYAINNAGIIAGVDSFSSGYIYGQHATLWNVTAATDLGTLGGTNSIAFAINNVGQVAGFAEVYYNGYMLGHVWNGAAPVSVTFISTPSSISDINDAGQVVGSSRGSQYAGYHSEQATLWDGTTETNLGTLGGTYSIAFAINNAGLVVGMADTADFYVAEHATLWNGITTTDLGTLGQPSSTGGYSSPAGSAAYAINNSGIVVGYSTIGAATHATLWNDTTITDLNSFLDASTVSAGWVLNRANGISDNGLIVGNASNNLLGITSHAFLLTPAAVPVPPAIWLFGSGLGLLAFYRKKG